MSLRRFLLGDPKGKTVWQIIKERWSSDQEAEDLEKEFAKLVNPLSLSWDRKVELADFPDEIFDVVALIDCRPRDGVSENDTRPIRYLLNQVAGDRELVLEAIKQNEEVLYTLFAAADEFGFDEAFFDILENEPTLRQTIEGEAGPMEMDYQKEFSAELKLVALSAEGITTTRVKSFSYIRRSAEEEEEEAYALVEVNDSDGWTTIYIGYPLDPENITTY